MTSEVLETKRVYNNNKVSLIDVSKHERIEPKKSKSFLLQKKFKT